MPFLWVILCLLFVHKTGLSHKAPSTLIIDEEIEKTTVYITAFEKEVQHLLKSPVEEFSTFRQHLPSKYPNLNIVLFLSSGFADVQWEGMWKQIVLRSNLMHVVHDLGPKELSFGGAAASLWIQNGEDVPSGVSLIFLRYVYDLLVLENEFIHTSPSTGVESFEGMHILEIGGGYGAFASVFSRAHSLDSYTIVDLDNILHFQEKFLSHVKNISDERKLLTSHSTSVPMNFKFVSPFADEPISSDLMYSFLALDATPQEFQLKYLSLYVANAKRGYLVLCSSLSIIKLLFDRVAILQPTAHLLFMDDLYGTLCDKSYFPLRLLWDSTKE